MSNLKKVFFIIILVILGIGAFLLVKIKMKEIEDVNESIRDEQAMIWFQEQDPGKYKEYEIVEMAIKGEWGKVKGKFSKNFRNKYRENESILTNIKIDDISYDSTYVGYDTNEFSWNVRQYIITSEGKKYRYYVIPRYIKEEIEGVESKVIDDIQIIDIIDLDNNDENIIHGVKFTEDTSTKLLLQMMFKYDGEAGLSKHFREKYPNFDGFYDKGNMLLTYERWNGDIINGFRLERHGSLDYSKSIVPNISIIDGYRGIQYTYNLRYTLDAQRYLDDFEMQFIDKSETKLNSDFYKKNVTYESIIRKLSGKNRNWQGLPISYSFRERYNENDGIFSVLEVDWVEFLCDTIGAVKYPIRLHLQDGSIKYYGLTFKLTNINLIDDIEKVELNVDHNKNYTVEELMSMY